jgi:hypothetical protein
MLTARVTPTEEGRRQLAATEVAIMADQLWIVFVDDVAQTDLLPYARSEEVALRLWREQPGRGGLPHERLRAVPKALDRAATALTIVRDIAYRLRDGDASINGADFLDHVASSLDRAGFLAEVRAASNPQFRAVSKKNPALAIAQNIALVLRDEHEQINGGDFLDYVTGELDAAGFLAAARASAEAERVIGEANVVDSPGAGGHWVLVPSHHPEELTTEEQAALRAWADAHAPRWKAALRDAWDTGNYGGSEDDAALQRVRNRLGPSWLKKYRLPVNPSHESKGYRCWVRTSILPNEAHTWVATGRAEAVSQVKIAVRQNNSEGGVESKDPEKPFEVTFAMEGGKLITTKHTD